MDRPRLEVRSNLEARRDANIEPWSFRALQRVCVVNLKFPVSIKRMDGTEYIRHQDSYLLVRARRLDVDVPALLLMTFDPSSRCEAHLRSTPGSVLRTMGAPSSPGCLLLLAGEGGTLLNPARYRGRCHVLAMHCAKTSAGGKSAPRLRLRGLVRGLPDPSSVLAHPPAKPSTSTKGKGQDGKQVPGRDL